MQFEGVGGQCDGCQKGSTHNLFCIVWYCPFFSFFFFLSVILFNLVSDLISLHSTDSQLHFQFFRRFNRSVSIYFCTYIW